MRACASAASCSRSGSIVAAPGVTSTFCVQPVLVRAVEERVGLVVRLLRDRVVFVIVTTRAFEREAEKGLAERVGAIDDVLDAVFLRIGAFFGIPPVQPVERCRDELLASGRGHQIACELPRDELVVRHVLVERVDDPVPPGMQPPLAVELVPVGVGKSGYIHPVRGHALAVAGRREQTVDDFFVGAGALIRDEGLALGLRRRQAREREGDAIQQ